MSSSKKSINTFSKISEHNDKLSLSGNLYRKNKRRISFIKLVKLLFISSTAVILVIFSLYGIFLAKKSNAESIDQNTILTALSKDMALPDGDVISMMRVSNGKELANQDQFYKNVSNGDYIIVYKNMVIIYDFDKNFIKNIKSY